MSYCILRTEKVKDRQQLTKAIEHNLRLRFQSNIDAKRTPQNQVLINSLGASLEIAADFQEKLTSYYKKLGVKERKDNVLMLEFMVSASPEFFAGKTPQQIQEWANAQIEFMRKEFGDQIKLAVLHLDEKTPHLHFMLGTEQKSTKRYKNQKGEFFKESWSLNARRYNPEFLQSLHDRHALQNKRFGLKRGVKGSMRNHTTLKEFYGLVDKAMDSDYQKQIEETIQTLETGILTNKVSIDQVREKFAPMLNKLIKQNKALKTKFAVDIKEWAADLAQQAEELELERETIAKKSAYYGKGLKKIADLEEKTKEQAKIIEALRLENERLQPKKNLTSNDPRYTLKA